MLIYILRGLVNNALQFEGIATGSISNLTHIDVKVDDLYAKVINTRPMFVFSMLR
jgi:hypothetical protein